MPKSDPTTCNCNAKMRGGAHLMGCRGMRVDRVEAPIEQPEHSLPRSDEEPPKREDDGRVARQG